MHLLSAEYTEWAGPAAKHSRILDLQLFGFARVMVCRSRGSLSQTITLMAVIPQGRSDHHHVLLEPPLHRALMEPDPPTDVLEGLTFGQVAAADFRVLRLQ